MDDCIHVHGRKEGVLDGILKTQLLLLDLLCCHDHQREARAIIRSSRRPGIMAFPTCPPSRHGKPPPPGGWAAPQPLLHPIQKGG